MKTVITLDKWDGSKSKAKTIYLDEISINDLVMLMMDSSVSGLTITKVNNLKRIVEKTTK